MQVGRRKLDAADSKYSSIFPTERSWWTRRYPRLCINYINADMKDFQLKKYVVFYSVLSAVLVVFFLKGMLLISRYGMTASGVRCVHNIENENQSITVEESVNHEFVFSVIVYLILNILRFIEYVLIGKGFYSFFFPEQKHKVDVQGFFNKELISCTWYMFLFLAILSLYLILGLSIPGLGIYQEIDHSERVAQCYRHYHEIYITYCIVNFLRYISAFTVRVMMICTTLYVRTLWFPKRSLNTQVMHYTLSSITFQVLRKVVLFTDS